MKGKERKRQRSYEVGRSRLKDNHSKEMVKEGRRQDGNFRRKANQRRKLKEKEALQEWEEEGVGEIKETGGVTEGKTRDGIMSR